MDRLVLERQSHQGHADLMVHSGVDNGLAGLGQVVDVVHVVEVAIPGRAVLRHQLGLHFEGIEPLRRQGHAGDRAGQDLEVDVRADCLTHFVLALEVSPDIEKRCLITGAAAELEVPDARLFGREFHGRQDVGEPDLAAERTLQTISKRANMTWIFFGFSVKITIPPRYGSPSRPAMEATAVVMAATTAVSIFPSRTGKTVVISHMIRARRPSRLKTATMAIRHAENRPGSQSSLLFAGWNYGWSRCRSRMTAGTHLHLDCFRIRRFEHVQCQL